MIFTNSYISDFILIATIAVISLHAKILHNRGRLIIFEPLFTFWAGILITNIYQPIIYYKQLLNWHQSPDIQYALFMSLFGVCFVILGYELNIGRRLRQRFIGHGLGLKPRNLLNVSLFSGAIGLVAYFIAFNSAGGLSQWLSNPRGGTDYAVLSGYLTQSMEFLGLSIWLFYYWALNVNTNKFWSAIGIVVGLIYLFWLFYLGTRSRLIIFTVLLLGSYFLPRKKIPNIAFSILLFVILLFATKLQETQRSNFKNLSFDVEQSAIWDVFNILTTGGNASDEIVASKGLDFNVTVTTLELVPDKVSFNYGYGLLEIITRPIPSFIWPEKNYPLAESFQGVYRMGGLTESNSPGKDFLAGPALNFVGYWYYMFGFVSLCLGGLMTGIIYRAIGSLGMASPETEGNYILLLFLSQIGFVDAAATPLTWIFIIPINILPLLFILKRKK